MQREGIRVLLEKAPDLGFLPSPTVSKGLQGQTGAILAKLDSWHHMRKRITGVSPYCVASEIQPYVRLIKVIVRLRETLGNVPG